MDTPPSVCEPLDVDLVQVGCTLLVRTVLLNDTVADLPGVSQGLMLDKNERQRCVVHCYRDIEFQGADIGVVVTGPDKATCITQLHDLFSEARRLAGDETPLPAFDDPPVTKIQAKGRLPRRVPIDQLREHIRRRSCLLSPNRRVRMTKAGADDCVMLTIEEGSSPAVRRATLMVWADGEFMIGSTRTIEDAEVAAGELLRFAGLRVT